MGNLLRRIACILSIGFLCLVIHPAHAQYNLWEPEDGVMVRQANHFTWTGDGVACDGEEYWCAAWSDGKSGAQNIIVQLYDSNNHEQWATGGLQITDLSVPQQQPLVAYAGYGNWLVAWEDYRGIPSGGEQGIAIQKISSDGTILWTSNGVLIEEAGEWTSLEKFYSLPDQSTLVFWRSHQGDLVQKFDSNGNPVWEEGGRLLEDNWHHIDVVVFDDGSFTVAFDGLVSMQHYDASGNPVWNEGEPVSLDSTSSDVRLIMDDQGNYFLTWVNSHCQSISAQHVSAEGTPLWDEPVNLTGLFHRVFDEGNYSAMHLNDDNCVLAWGATDQDGNYSLRMRLFDSSTENGNPGELQGTVLFPEESLEYCGVKLCPDNEDGFIITSSDAHGKGTGSEIHAMRFDENGDYLWNDGEPLRIPMDGLPCTLTFSTFIQENTVRVFWPDHDPGVGDEAAVQFLQYELHNGNAVFEEPFPLATGMLGNGRESRIIRSGDNIFVLWKDCRDSLDIYVQKLDAENGEQAFQQDGKRLPCRCYVDQFQSYERTIFIPNNEGGLTMLHSSVDNNYNWTFSLDRFSANLDPVWDQSVKFTERGMFSYYDETDFQKSMVRYDQDGNCFIAWEELLNHVVCNCVDASGNLLWGDTGVALAGQHSEPAATAILDDGNFVVWYNYQNDSYLARLNSEGEIVWNVEIFDFDVAYFRGPAIYPRNDDILLTWVNAADNTQLMGQSVNLNGEVQWEEDGRVLIDKESSSAYSACKNLVLNSDDSFWLTWRDRLELDNAYAVQCQLFSSEGQPLLNQENSIILPGQNEAEINSFREYRAVTDDQDGMYIFYEVNNDYGDDIGYTHIDADGNFTQSEFENGTAYLVDAQFGQEDISIIPDGFGGVLASWTDYRGQPVDDPVDDIYVMRVNDNPFGVHDKRENLHPVSWELHNAYPNPFNPSTTLSFTTPHSSEVTLSVYDVLGRKVATLVDGMVQAGRQQVIWQGHSDQGMPVASGTYFVRLEGDGVNLTSKMVLLK